MLRKIRRFLNDFFMVVGTNAYTKLLKDQIDAINHEKKGDGLAN